MKRNGSYLTDIPHNGKLIKLFIGVPSGYYDQVADNIETLGLRRSSSSEIASLVYDAWRNHKGKDESKILNILSKDFIWELGTGNLYLPKSNEEINNGVLIEFNPRIDGAKPQMDKDSLIKRLITNDPLVKFVPFGFKVGEQSIREFGRNAYVLARYGQEGASKIAEIASKYDESPLLSVYDSVDEEKIMPSALALDIFHERVDVVGNNWGSYCDKDGYTGGYSFGLDKDK
jgi:hypothetical protein